MEAKSERNAALVQFRIDNPHLTTEDIGRKFKVSASRVSQILKVSGAVGRTPLGRKHRRVTADNVRPAAQKTDAAGIPKELQDIIANVTRLYMAKRRIDAMLSNFSA